MSSEGQFFRGGGALTITRTNLDGLPRAGKGSWRLLALAQPAEALLPADEPAIYPSKRQSDAKSFHTAWDQLRSRATPGYSPELTMAHWKDAGEKAHGEVTHDAKGVATVTLPALLPGAYRLRYSTIDDFGAKFDTWKDVIIAAPEGQRTALALPLYLGVETPSVEVGGTARLLVLSGLRDQELFFDRFRSGKLVERRRLRSDQPSLIEFPIKDGDRGGFAVAVTTVRDHQQMSMQGSVFVPWSSKQLELSFATFRDKLRPGAKESWRVTVKAGKKPLDQGVAEILAYMYDRSLDLFAPHSPGSPMSLWPVRLDQPQAHASLGQSGGQWVFDENFVRLPVHQWLWGDQLRFFPNYPIGGPGRRNREDYYAHGAYNDGVRLPTTRATDAIEVKTDGDRSTGGENARKSSDPALGNIFVADMGKSAAPPSPRATAVRSNFAETAFFLPQLLTDKSGSATIEFSVPDSVTSWNVWVHAITRDLRSGSVQKEVRSVKDLMVRPYLPRFFREGDRATLKVVVNNASDHPISGELNLEIFDDDKSALAAFGLEDGRRAFTVPPGGGTHVRFELAAPKRVGTYAFKVVARSKDLSDGEQRPLPVLPGRMHLVQSRFVTLRDQDRREMTFADLAHPDDPTLVSEQLVVTLDTQLFFTVLKALPYLVEYPYECTEQTLNRFVSTGIVSSLCGKYPAVAKMAAEFSKRKTVLDPWDSSDPSRKMTLEESPWLQESRGRPDVDLSLLNVLDPQIARSQRDVALDKLRGMQTSLGAFPWFPGGPPSPYMTLYLLYGLSKAAEFKIYVPHEMVQRGWQYLARHFRDEYVGKMRKGEADPEFLTFLNYVASAYPDPSWTGGALTQDERKEILAYCFKDWRAHSPYLKGLLALTLKRAGRAADAKLVFDSVMDSAKTTKDEGTFWAPEDRSWLWYNDTIESHAFALRTLMELDPKNPKKDGLVLWLLLNKKLNQWKSTRATAEVIYTLVKVLEQEQSLGVRELVKVAVGPRAETFTFEPDRYVGKTQVVVPGPEVDANSAHVVVDKQTKGYAFASATWHFSTEKLPTQAKGDFFHVERTYFRRIHTPHGFELQPLADGAQVAPGDEVEIHLSLLARHAAEYVHLRDPRAAGLEPESAVSLYKWDLGIGWYEEVRDSGTNFFFEQLPVGEYTFKYRLRANLAGTFKVGPATVESMYAPEFAAYSAGTLLTVK